MRPDVDELGGNVELAWNLLTKRNAISKNPIHPIAFDIKSLILLVVSIFRDRKNVVFLFLRP